MRQRDERVAEQARYRQQPDPLHDKSATEKKVKTYGPEDFSFDPATRTCVCPVHAARTNWTNEGRHAVEVVLPGAQQHREAGAPWVWAVRRKSRQRPATAI
jgi:hypothetical protein